MTVIELTCNEGGCSIYTCSCGKIYKGDFTEQYYHEFDTRIEEPTCATRGTEITYCIRGDYTHETDIGYTKHQYEGDFCTFCGCSHEKYFSHSGLSETGTNLLISQTETIPAHIVVPTVYMGCDVITIQINWCQTVESIVIPSGIELGYSAFEYCFNLKDVYLPSSIHIIDNTFSNCTSIENIYYDGTIEEWEKIEKIGDWDWWMGDYTIHCSNGDITVKIQ